MQTISAVNWLIVSLEIASRVVILFVSDMLLWLVRPPVMSTPSEVSGFIVCWAPLLHCHLRLNIANTAGSSHGRLPLPASPSVQVFAFKRLITAGLSEPPHYACLWGRRPKLLLSVNVSKAIIVLACRVLSFKVHSVLQDLLTGSPPCRGQELSEVIQKSGPHANVCLHILLLSRASQSLSWGKWGSGASRL